MSPEVQTFAGLESDTTPLFHPAACALDSHGKAHRTCPEAPAFPNVKREEAKQRGSEVERCLQAILHHHHHPLRPV